MFGWGIKEQGQIEFLNRDERNIGKLMTIEDEHFSDIFTEQILDRPFRKMCLVSFENTLMASIKTIFSNFRP